LKFRGENVVIRDGNYRNIFCKRGGVKVNDRKTNKQRASDIIGVVLMAFWTVFWFTYYGLTVGRRPRVANSDIDIYLFDTVSEFLPVALAVTACIASFIWWFVQDDVVYNPGTSFSMALKCTIKSFVGICLLLALFIAVILPMSSILFPDLFPIF
jgi:hypothetical protein